jgi:hypothetical protein
VLRLLQIKDMDATIHTVVLILGAMAAVWTISWLSNRAATRRRRSPAPRAREEAPGSRD